MNLFKTLTVLATLFVSAHLGESSAQAQKMNQSFHNHTVKPIDFVISDQKGTVTGWYTVAPGKFTTVRGIASGSFYVHAIDSDGKFKIPSARKIDGIVKGSIPMHRKKFKLVRQKDGSWMTWLNGQYLGRFNTTALVKLGFRSTSSQQYLVSGHGGRVTFN